MVLRTHAPILPRRSVISRRCNAIRALEKVRLSAAYRRRDYGICRCAEEGQGTSTRSA